MVDDTIGDVQAPSTTRFSEDRNCFHVLPASLRHQMLELAIIFMCSIGQLSPGAYFLRRDLFPSIAIVSWFSCSVILTKELILSLFRSTVCKIA
jgi:hypothetical protein